MMKKRNNIKNFDVQAYLFENQNPSTSSQYGNVMESKDDYYLKTECCYLIKFEQVFGTLILKKDCMIFEPSEDIQANIHLVSEENCGTPKEQIQEYAGIIDFLDICEVNKMNLVNEKAILSSNSFIRESYKFNLFLQIVLTTVNGVTLKSKSKEKIHGALLDDHSAIMVRNEIPIANIYFKFQHKDLSQK